MSRATRRLLISSALLVLTAAVYQRAAVAQDVLPKRLSQTGLAGPRPGGSEVLHGPAVRLFSPQYPLWTDGAAKRRWVYLPPGTAIDASNPDHWNFPDGTKFWKEFSFGGRKVETRLLWKRNGEWTFATYVWNDAQTDAELAPADGLWTAAEVAPGKRHRIPSLVDCRACHVAGRVEVLGFTALQLSDDRDPAAIHGEPLTADMITLRALIADNRLANAPAVWSQTSPRINAPDGETRAILGYLSTNCGSCHNAVSELAALNFDVKASSSPAPCAAALATTFDRPGKWTIPASPEHSRRIAPGQPDLSAVLARMKSRRPVSQMPPLGTAVADADAVARLTRWIAQVAPTLHPCS